MSIDVLLVDDNEPYRRGVRELLRRARIDVNGNSQTLRVLEASTAEQALSTLDEESPAIALVDLAIPKADQPASAHIGLNLVRDIAAQHPKTKVIVITQRRDSTLVDFAVQAGAYSYLLKDDDDREEALLRTVAMVASNNIVLGAEPSTRVREKLKGEDRLPEPFHKLDPKTDGIGIAILQAVAAGAIEPVDIVRRLNNDKINSKKTIENHLSTIVGKCKLRSREALFFWAGRALQGPSKPD